MCHTDRLLSAVSSNLEQNHVARTFAQKLMFLLCKKTYVDQFDALGVNSNSYMSEAQVDWLHFV
jgi:hypothetical protein